MRARVRPSLRIAALATIVAAVFVLQTWALGQISGRTITFGDALRTEVPPWYLWALCTPLLRRLAAMIPRRASMAAIAGASIATLHTLATMAVIWMLSPTRVAWPGYARLFIRVLPLDCVVLAALLALLAAAQLEAQASRAELRALRSQLEPHFLLNALNGISALVATAPERAEEMLSHLGEFLRRSVATSAQAELTVAEELRFAASYAAIQRIRFDEMLRFETAVSDDAANALVPNLIVQPLVENAVRHGLAPRAGRGWIRVTAKRVRDELVIEVRDSGVGVEAGADESTGLTNTRLRLRAAYGDAASLIVTSANDVGTIATVRMPFRIAGELQPRREAVR